MKISVLARETGLSQSRIRYYESIGLLPQVDRGRNGYRRYSDDTAQALRIITGAQRAGFSLNEIRALMPQAGASGWDHPKLLASLQTRLAGIEKMQADLARTHAELSWLVEQLEQHTPGGDCAANTRRLMTEIKDVGSDG